MKKYCNFAIVNWNLPIYDDLQFIKDHICYLNSYYIYDINLELLDIKNQVYIFELFKYNCDELVLDLIKSNVYAQQIDYLILKLPIYYHNRNLCLIQSVVKNYIAPKNAGTKNAGIINDDYLIIFRESSKYNALIDKQYNDILEDITKSHMLSYYLE